MIAQESQLKLQAYLDGELAEGERAEVEALMARDAEAMALFAELSNTTKALAGHEAEIHLPESREFFWSKIERQIERERQSKPVREPARMSLFAWVQRHLMPVSGAALLACLIGTFALRGDGSVIGVGETELASDDMGSYTYRDQEQDVTMVWLYDHSDDSQDGATSDGGRDVAPQ
jgi:anti-sigma factor RsiW